MARAAAASEIEVERYAPERHDRVLDLQPRQEGGVVGVVALPQRREPMTKELVPHARWDEEEGDGGEQGHRDERDEVGRQERAPLACLREEVRVRQERTKEELRLETGHRACGETQNGA